MSDENYEFDNVDEMNINNDDGDDDPSYSLTNQIPISFSEISSQPIESILSLSYQENKLGAAFYRFGSTNIELLHEIYEFDDFTVIQTILNKFSPNIIIISSKCETKLFYLLEKYSNQKFSYDTSENSNNDTINSSEALDNSVSFENSTLNNLILNSYNLYIVSSLHFNYDQCKSRILSINFPQISNINDKTERFIYLTSYINFFETNTIKSLGVLLHCIEKQMVIQKSSREFYPNSLSNFIYIDLEYFVSIDQLTFEALDIFRNEWHPSVSKKGFAKKEGFTLYGIFNSCASKIGSLCLKKLFLQPITDVMALEERLDIIEFFIKPNNSNFKETIHHFLKNIKDISSTITRLKSLNFTITDFKLLKQTVTSVISIRNLVSNSMFNSNVNLKIFEKISKQFTKDLDEINECLDKAIDFKKSKDDGKIKINKGIDGHLDRLKFYFNKLPEILKIAITKEDSINVLIQKYDLHITIIYLPQLGFLLKLLLIETQKVNDIDKYGFDLIFCANDSAYYKNSQTIQFDKIFGDILSEINDRTQQILIIIKDFILKRVEILSMAINCCALLDAMIAMAQTAIEYDFNRPNLTCYGTIKIHQGRHPLYDLITNSFVPNDYYSDNELCKTLVVFGLNGSGKTVYLKQVCLIVFLAHIGSFVPAKFAEITIVDKIFTRIRTPESISTQMSSFKHDLNQMIAATKYARRRSLVVIDLFGKSTLHSDGFALMKAFLNYWVNNRENGPHLVISTQLNMFSKLIHDNKVQYYILENVDGRRNFKIKPYQKKGEKFSEHPIPEMFSINNNNNNNENHNKLISQLEFKQKRYLELADLIINNQPLEIINQFIMELNKPIIN